MAGLDQAAGHRGAHLAEADESDFHFVVPLSRHCEPTGRANARPMTGSAKQYSCGRLRIEIMARLSMLRVLRGSSSRPHTAPQQYSVSRSWNGRLKSSTFFSALLT